MKFKQKKGELTDFFVFLITLFILAIGLFVIIYIIPHISNGLRVAGLNNTAEGETAIQGIDNIGSVINYGFLMLFVGLTISMMISSFLVRTHPIFLFMYIFFLAMTIILSLYLGNAYYNLQNNPIFAATMNSASFINKIMNNIVEITLGVAALSLVIIFSKFSTFGGSQPL